MVKSIPSNVHSWQLGGLLRWQVIEGIEEQPENVYPPMRVTVSGIMMGHDRLLQFQKASYILVVPIGIFVLFRFSQKAKAEPRLQLVIEEGRVTETRLVQP
jgi:hypothetical protein